MKQRNKNHLEKLSQLKHSEEALLACASWCLEVEKEAKKKSRWVSEHFVKKGVSGFETMEG